MMKELKKKSFVAVILLTLSMGMALTSCLSNEDPYNAGFYFVKPTNVSTGIYANNTGDSLVMQCLGPWKITAALSDQSWCTIDLMSGKGSAIYSLGVHFTQNTTGAYRLARFTIRDTDHPDEAYCTWQYVQYATRGNGSLGNAPLVKTITSSDGYVASISYDEFGRPVKYALTTPEGGVGEMMDITYNDNAGVMTVSRGGFTLTGNVGNASQPETLISANDTIGYQVQYYSNGLPVSMTNAFKFVAVSGTRGIQAYSYLLNGQSLAPDSLHLADSLKYKRVWNSDRVEYVEKLKLEYSDMDNRCQSVDPNQLLLGFADCHSMQLLSMFRYTRSTSIIKRALSAEGSIEVTTELNADKSIRQMIVKDARKGTEVTYDFTY